jgi:hypothetical protein
MASNVMTTLHDHDAHRCVKIIKQADGMFGYQEFRRDPEDAGGWTLVGDHLRAIPTQEEAVAAARAKLGWLREATRPQQVIAWGTTARPLRVVASLHNDSVDRCVDIIANADATFGFKECRRDPEDGGGWTLVSYNPRAVFATQEQAIAAAKASVAWLRDRVAHL